MNKLYDGKLMPVNNVVYMYFGVYDGRMRPADREAAGMLYYSYDRLRQEIAENTADFTDDIIQMCNTYESEIIDFQNQIKSSK